MKQLVGVMSPVEVFNNPIIESMFKREVLLFQKVSIPHLNCLLSEKGCSPDRPRLPQDLIRHLEWLLENNVIVGDLGMHSEISYSNPDEKRTLLTETKKLESILEPWIDQRAIYQEKQRSILAGLDSIIKEMKQFLASNRSLRSNRDIKLSKTESTNNRSPLFDEKMFQRIEEREKLITEAEEPFQKARLVYGQYLARIAAIDFRNNGEEAHPVFYSSPLPITIDKAKKQDVLQIVIKVLPIPDDSTSWERILDYRSDPDSHGKFLSLKNWMNEVARAELTPAEIQDKLECLIHDYEQHMQRHKIRTNSGTLQTLLVGVAEVLENTLKLELGKLAKGVFFIRNRKIALMEAEAGAPGKEIAYIVKTKNSF